MIAVNWLAVLAGGIGYMVVGYLWYGPLFGKMWKGLMGLTDESMKSMSMKPWTAMAWGLVSALVMSYVLTYFMAMAGVSDVMGAITMAFWVWLGFLATQSLGSYLWEGRPFQLFVLNAANQLVGLLVMAAAIVLVM
jgi:hypothetical protein